MKKLLLLLPFLAACALAPGGLRPAYEMATLGTDADVARPVLGVGIPCAEVGGADAEDAACLLLDVAPDEDAAFRKEAERLETDSLPRCRQLGEAMVIHMVDVRMYDRAIIRYAGPYKYYGVGHSYQVGGEWMIRIARRLDDLNARRLEDKLRTLRHEVSHTLGAQEERVGMEWTAADYAERCG